MPGTAAWYSHITENAIPAYLEKTIDVTGHLTGSYSTSSLNAANDTITADRAG